MRNLVILGAMVLGGCNASSTPSNPVDVVDYQTGKASLHQVVQQKLAVNKTPVLYFYADWCGSCRRYRQSLTEPAVEAALAKASLIKINIDVDTVLAAEYGIQAIPTFIKVDGQGNSMAQITSDEWENDEPEEIAAVMTKLVKTTAYDKQAK